MSDIPKIVRNRLQAVQVAGDHPEPNLLAAFGENTLRRDERERMLKHLAACADCRDVLALATPELSATIAPIPARTGWLRSPALRWAAAGACVVVVGAAVSLRYGPHPAQTQPADLGTVAQSSAPAVAAEVQAPRAQAVVPERKPAELDFQKKLADKVEARSTAKRALIDEELAKKSNERAANSFAVGGAAATPANQPAAPASGLGGFSEPAARDQEARSADLKEQKPAETDKGSVDVVAQAETATSSRDGFAAPISGKAKDSDEARLRMKQDASGSLAYAVRAPAKAEGLYRTDTAVVPRWKVSKDGVLQRSSDSGQTWQPVPVATKITFRAVASIGADVWAGGSAGSLYHSTDSGRSWTRITPADSGASLTTDIITITFSALQHLELTTATHETWSTADSGQTWQKH